MWDFEPWSKRNSEPEPRIHEELTDAARKRIAHSLRYVQKEEIKKAYNALIENTGQDPNQFRNKHSLSQAQYEFIIEEDDQDILIDYLEYVINITWRATQTITRHTTNKYNDNTLGEAVIKIEKALIEEGILIQIKPSPLEEMRSENWSRRSDYEKIWFQPLSDETIIEADQELRVLALGDTWKEPLEGYNEAWDLYKEGTFTYVIPEKLYNSLEQVCKKICIEEEGWLEEGATVGDCLSELREHGLFKPNGKMIGEWQQIISGIQVGVQRTGGDRKRHERIDQDYLIMILHQVSAFLTFVIKRYERGVHENTE